MLYGNEDIFATLEYFGTQATVFIDTDNEISVTGIFDEAEMVYGDDLKLVQANPTFICREIDIENVKQDMSITINNKAYKIRKLLSDGTGVTVIDLKK